MRTHSADLAAVAAIDGVQASFSNTTSWYNNASFLLPLVATLVVATVALVSRHAELLGFAAFLACVTAAMLPVVLGGWRQTATVVVITNHGVISLHNGRVLKSLDWNSVQSVQQRETQGNVRWEIASRSGERLLLDGELASLPRLIGLAQTLSRTEVVLAAQSIAWDPGAHTKQRR